MRYTLRNQHKIRDAYSQEFVDRLLRSLNFHFNANEKIDGNVKKEEPYPIILVDDIDHTVNIFAFYVVSTVYDVYNLAFKETMG